MRWQRIMFVGVRHSPATWPWGQGGDWRVPPGSTTTMMMMAMRAWRPREMMEMAMGGDGWRWMGACCVWVSGGFALDTSTNTGSPGCRLTQALHLHSLCFPEGERVNTNSAVACLGPAILLSPPSPSPSLLSLSLLESVALFSLHPPAQPSLSLTGAAAAAASRVQAESKQPWSRISALLDLSVVRCPRLPWSSLLPRPFEAAALLRLALTAWPAASPAPSPSSSSSSSSSLNTPIGLDCAVMPGLRLRLCIDTSQPPCIALSTSAAC
jgi:hypothetical protein